jgi:predicted RNA-binding protein with PUA-like domain
MSEQIEAEIHSKNQAIKTQEKTLQKYEDLKATLSDEKTKAEAVKELNLKMEEEITVKNVKIQDFTVQMASLQNEILEKESEVLEVNEKLGN